MLLYLYHFNHDLFTGVARYASEANWILDKVWRRPGLVRTWSGDGLLCLDWESEIDHLLADGLPAVGMLPPRADEPRRFPRVYQDGRAIGAMGAEHLLERGFEHLAFFCPAESVQTANRVAGFREAVEAAGQTAHIVSVSLDLEARMDASRQHAHLAEQIRRLPRPLGLMAFSDDYAAWALDVCLAAGLHVPEEVAILGVDNDDTTCRFAAVPLSSVDNDLQTLGHEAAHQLDLLIDRAQRVPTRKPKPRGTKRAGVEPGGDAGVGGGATDRDALTLTVIPPKGVVTRVSTDIVALPHVGVASALRYIWDHFGDTQLTVSQVASAVDMSVRGLEYAFDRHLRRRPADVLRETRLREIKRLLRETNQTIDWIAARCGLSSANSLHRMFRSHTGVTPRQYRMAQTDGDGQD